MLSYQINEYYQFLLHQFKDFETCLDVLLEYEEKYRTHLSRTTTKILAESNAGTSGSTPIYTVNDNALISTFNTLNVELSSKFNFFDAFSKFALLKNNVSNYKSVNGINLSIEDEIILLIEDVFSSYQQYLQTQNNRSKAVIFAEKTILFKSKFSEFISFSTKTVALFESATAEIEANEKIKVLDIQLLEVEFSLSEFSACLNNIENIYHEFERITKSELSTELKIVKIESGSLLAKILGDKNIIETLSLLLRKSIDLCFNKFTREGKVLRHSELRSQLSADLDLRTKMKSIGLDTTIADENMEKTFAMITKGTLELTTKTSKFKIDGEIIEAKDYATQKYLEIAQTKYLTSTTEENNEIKD